WGKSEKRGVRRSYTYFALITGGVRTPPSRFSLLASGFFSLNKP
ncbi:MAG: hypothetical protein AVDCRST_MAG56-4434, partial [uncultured Cytophagales bacterium]